MNFRDNIQTLSDIEIGLVGGANDESEETVGGDSPRDTCTWKDPWSCWPV